MFTTVHFHHLFIFPLELIKMAAYIRDTNVYMLALVYQGFNESYVPFLFPQSKTSFISASLLCI